MSEPKTYPSAPVELPVLVGVLEPTPVDGCASCIELAKVRDWARAGNDQTTVTDCNVLMARHHDEHETPTASPREWTPGTAGEDVMTVHRVREGKPVCGAVGEIAQWQRAVTCPACQSGDQP